MADLYTIIILNELKIKQNIIEVFKGKRTRIFYFLLFHIPTYLLYENTNR